MPNTVTEEGNGLSQAFSVLSTVAIILVTVAICVILFYYWKKRSLSTNEDNYTQTETGEAQNWTKLNNLRSINTWESIRQFGQYINSYPLKLKIDQSKLNADKRVSNSSKINGNVSNTFNNSNLRGSKERSPSNILSVNNPSSNKQVGEKNVDKTARQNVSYLDESIVVSAKTGPVSLVSDEFNQNNSVSQVSTSTITENTTSDDINSRTVQTVDTINTLADKSQKILSIPGYKTITPDN